MLVVAFPLFWQNRFDHFQPKARESAERNLSGPDRKSTRLNSSHGYISYAVFCLKKKILSIPRGSIRDVGTQPDFMHVYGKLYLRDAKRTTVNLKRIPEYVHVHATHLTASSDDRS